MHVQRAAGRVAAALAAPLMLAGVLTGLGPAAASAATCQAWTGGQQPPSPGDGNSD
jgi:ABC-type sugar transport system substrate-binding protein